MNLTITLGMTFPPTCYTKANEVDSCVTFRQKTGPLNKGKFCSLRTHLRKIGFIASSKVEFITTDGTGK